jgi:hypothetical protein
MKEDRGEARVTDLDFLPPAGHATGLAASVLWTFPVTVLGSGWSGGDMNVAWGLGGVGVPVGIICGSWAGGDEGSGCKISERVKSDGGAEKTLTRTWR